MHLRWFAELENNWQPARTGQPLNYIAPMNAVVALPRE
jgi:hypothetical protein